MYHSVNTEMTQTQQRTWWPGCHQHWRLCLPLISMELADPNHYPKVRHNRQCHTDQTRKAQLMQRRTRNSAACWKAQ